MEVAPDDGLLGSIVTQCSVARGRTMSPGIQQAPFYWRDVVDGPPPRRRWRGDCVQVTLHGMDDTGEVRIGFTTMVRVDPGMDKDSYLDDIVHVEERINVQRRLLQEFIDRERALSDRLALRMRSRLAHTLMAQRRRVNAIQTAWLASFFLVLIRLQARVGDAGIRGIRAGLRSLVAVPDMVLTHGENARIHLASRSGRRTLRTAFGDPRNASPEEKTLVLVVLAFGLVASVLVLNTVFTTVFPQGAPAYRDALADFTASLLSVLALPIPAEPILIGRTIAVGAVLAFTGLFLGKLVGSWMLYLLGDSLFDAIEKKTAKSPRMRRAIGVMQRNADRWGFLMLVIINSVPLMPDLLVYVFAVSGMRFRTFMLGVGVGTALKFIGIIIGVQLIGPDVVSAFFAHPIQTLRGG